MSLLLQLVTVYNQNKGRGMKAISYEVAIVVLIIKPAVIARRVARGDSQAEGT